MNRIIILPMVLIFCFSMSSCGKSASERLYDKAMKDSERMYERAQRDAERMMDKYDYGY